MNDNLYKTPESALEFEKAGGGPQFYVVSTFKFSVLYFSTLGLYILYWFYKNWALYKNVTGEKMWPVARAIFSIFFAHALFVGVDDALKNKGNSYSWDPRLFASGYILLSIVNYVMDRLSAKDIGSPYTDIASLAVLPILYFTLLTPQKAINMSQNDPTGSDNNRITAANFGWIFIGVLLWILGIIGLLDTLGYLNLE